MPLSNSASPISIIDLTSDDTDIPIIDLTGVSDSEPEFEQGSSKMGMDGHSDRKLR
jgi:hypothetical protein